MSAGEPDIYHGDARNMDMLDDATANLVVTSPPYNLGVDYSDIDDDLDPAEYCRFISEVLEECYRILDDDGRLAINVGLGVGRPLTNIPRIVQDCAEEAGFSLRDVHIWDKGESESSSAWGSWRSSSNPREIIQHEKILIFYKHYPGRQETRLRTIGKDDFMEITKSVWHVSPETAVDHPAPYPPEIPRRLINLHSYSGDTVVDPFVGSGTTCAVASALDRRAIGIDLSEEYVEMAEKRCNGSEFGKLNSENRQSTLAESWS